MNRIRVVQTLEKISKIGATANGMERIAYSEAERQAKQFVREQCEQLGMTVREDEAGNLIARKEGIDPSLPAVAVGSHLDTVYNGGKYDGTLGVIAGLEIVRMLAEEEINTLHPVELIAFACEESARFNASTLGSKAMTGFLDLDSLRSLKDKDDRSIQEVVAEQGLEFESMTNAARSKEDIKVFLELHIEQGSKLIDRNKTIGVVTGIAAPMRLSLTIDGKSSHSGTTGMKNRSDAFLAAAELSLIVEKAALAEEQYETVATVGVVDVLPGAMNVVPGKASLKIDIRSTNGESRKRVLAAIKQEIERVEQSRNVKVTIDWQTEEEPVMMDEMLVKKMATICENRRIPYSFLPSGAGHDSMYMAKRWPTALLFVPSVDGLSHHPDEFTEAGDIMTGIGVMKEAVLAYAIEVNNKSKRRKA
ncbi:Zn-dependent hydrolase [Alkalihalobacillus oceani]|uniref:Zn-dependent hydrolase n=1 Tax=Halalkalibacter oceani TaxID=1653776 RepID=A0A9X2DPL1_9BACI|nr:Zn-dependent hydrolase [Halalkalibacter oceani]MCM3712723.1 Zn-dependent hydrolase [Halalkalibacter oceani]